MTIRESRDALVRAAAGIDAVAAELLSARGDVSRGDGRGSEFGLLAAGIGAQHDAFIDQMIVALGGGDTVMADIAQALRDTATDFGATDTSVADEFHNLDGTPEMTDYDHHIDFRNDVEIKLQDFSDKIQEGVNWVIDQWEACVGNQKWMWFVSPAVKIAYELAGDRIQDAINEIWDTWETETQKIWDSVDDLTGDPFELMAMNQSYFDAAGKIRDEKIVLDRIVSVVGDHWEGDAFDAFTETVGEQKNAISGVDSGLSDAATACAEGAQQINSVWTDVVLAILDYAGSIVDAIKDGTDAGQWVTLDTGPALKVILDAAIKAAALAVTLETYWAENATVKESMWRGLASGLDGLDAKNNWPTIAASRAGDLGDKGEWGMR